MTTKTKIKNNEMRSERIRKVCIYVKENEMELRRKYANENIAIYDDKSGVLGHGTNHFKLRDKINKDKPLNEWVMVGTIDDILKYESAGGRNYRKTVMTSH